MATNHLLGPVIIAAGFYRKKSFGKNWRYRMLRAIYIGVKMYIRDCRHDKELKSKQWAWRLFRVRDKDFDYSRWKRGSLWKYIKEERDTK